jgi:hypothetical protein
MKSFKLHQWLPLLFTLVIFTACSKKNFPGNNSSEAQDRYENTTNTTYTPPAVISISDELAKSNKEGEMYYDNEYGYRYWRFCDGKYYLDTKYSSGAKPERKMVKKQNKKQRKKAKETDYASE